MPSLYANLLDANAPKGATISSAPVKYEFKPKETDAQAERKKSDAALRFQPVKRNQGPQKPKPRPTATSSSSDRLPVDRKLPAPAAGGLSQWTGDDDLDDNDYAWEYKARQDEERKRQRMASRKWKKRKGDSARTVDFDEIYNPENPTRPQDYQGSEEQANAEHEWKQRLHAHQLKRRWTSPLSSSDDEHAIRKPRQAFAPPPDYDFAPPTMSSPAAALKPVEVRTHSGEPYVPPHAVNIPEDKSGEDAYLRRMHLRDEANTNDRPPPAGVETAVPQALPTPPPPPPLVDAVANTGRAPQQVTTAPTPPQPAQAAEPPISAFNVLSAAPVRYAAPIEASPLTTSNAPEEQSQGGLGFGPSAESPAAEVEEPEQDTIRSNRPGQKGFAKRLLEKHGWKQGQGLGASATGIITPLQHMTTKRKKRPDAEGGGWANPAGMGRIVGGKKVKPSPDTTSAADGAANDDGEEEQAWSIVACFKGMLDGLDLEYEISEGNLMQRIGDRVGEYGIVERLYIDREPEWKGRERVFVKFTSALSAYRAVQASQDQDFLGNGRVVKSGFFNADKFEQGIYA